MNDTRVRLRGWLRDNGSTVPEGPDIITFTRDRRPPAYYNIGNIGPLVNAKIVGIDKDDRCARPWLDR